MSSATARKTRVLLGLCFLLAVLSFVGASVLVDRRFQRVTEMTYQVSDNAMPSIAELGTMRLALEMIHHDLDEATQGGDIDPSRVEAELRALDEARLAYEQLPQFPGEPQAWARVRTQLNGASYAAAQVLSDLNAGALRKAGSHLEVDYVPVAANADAGLLELRRSNLDEGNAYARRAQRYWRKSRVIAVVLNAVCVVMTGALAWAAWRGTQRALASEVRRADELDQFAARVAHDIRGPLSVPLLALQRLDRDAPAGSSQKSLVERGVRSLRHVEVLVQDLLTFARSAEAPNPDARAPLSEVISGVVNDVQEEAEAARVRVVVTDLPSGEVSCARGVLSSIVGNLVTNAIKYMPPAARERNVVVRATTSASRVHIEVSDSGGGIPKDAQARIFQPHVRADVSHPGLGLGLATVKRLVEAHGGKLGLDSKVGRGSVFWFELPARTA